MPRYMCNVHCGVAWMGLSGDYRKCMQRSELVHVGEEDLWGGLNGLMQRRMKKGI